MAKVRGAMPNVINGISQQADSLRLSSQSSLDDNTYPLIVDGLIKRPPMQFLARLANSDIDDSAFVHHIIRDESEQYTLTIDDNGDVRVHDWNGTLQTLTDSSGTYLNGMTDASAEIAALTIADHTFIVNKSKTVAADAATATARDYEGCVWVKQGAYGADYIIKINGSSVATFTAPDGSSATHTASIRTNYIAQQLYTALVGAGYNTGAWSTYRYGSVLVIQNDTTDFGLTAEDSLGESSCVAVKGKVSNLENLPPTNQNGFKIEVSGADNEEGDNYWVEFEYNDSNTARGIYKETIKPGAKLRLDEATMPHLLIRQSDGTWDLEPTPWVDREVGDEDSVPDPSLVDNKIVDVFFHRNRLGFLTENNIVMSQNGDFYNFYRSTLTTLLDTDPIDIAPSHVKVSLLRHAVPYQDELMVFSEKTQFRIAGNELLTPASVAARPLTEVSADPAVRPAAINNLLYFPQESDSYCHLYEYFYDKATETAEANNVSGHANRLIPSGVTNLAVANDLQLIAITTGATGYENYIYIYKYFISDREKLQSAWVRWVLTDVERVGALDFDGSWLVVSFYRDSRWFVGRLNCEEGQLEAVHLDDRYAILTGSYSSGNDETTYTAPTGYTVDANTKIVSGSGGALPLGYEFARVGASTSLIVEGDHSTQPVFIGFEYESRHRFSPFFYRRGDQNTSIVDGRLQIRNLSLEFSYTSYFDVEVTTEGRPTKTYTYAGAVAGNEDAVTGVLITDSGSFNVPILSRNDRVTIDVVSPNWRPFSINSASWRGTFNPIVKDR